MTAPITVTTRLSMKAHTGNKLHNGCTTPIKTAGSQQQLCSPSQTLTKSPPKEVKSPPLYETVDVSGIENAFFGSDSGENTRRGAGTVEFRYTEYLVKVRSDGWIQVYEPSKPEQG